MVAAATEAQTSFWSRLTTPARAGLVAGIALIIIAVVALAIWSSGTDYQVLFTHLGEGDAASVVEQLKHQKIPYQLADGGTTIKVPAGQVYETRLALVSGGTPLSGGVGFEIFDRQGFGATEQSQRVEYQRALQGELARTITALDSVKSARVHLVLPENTMFKRDREEARAAVSLILNPGASLTAEQTAGVQRLVAASVSGLDAAKVVITDQRGITLAGADSTATGGAGSDARLAIKRDIESYLTGKVASLLDRAFGTGQALVSVDVALNFDEIKSSVQDLVPWHGVSPTAEGAVTHRRQVETGGSASSQSLTSDAGAAGSRPSGTTSEVEYEYGHRVEQVIAAPGGITRMSVGVIVPGELSEDKKHRITDLVRVAAGINDARGDAVVVQPLDELGVTRAAAQVDTAAPDSMGDDARTVPPARALTGPAHSGWAAPALLAVGVVFALLGILTGVVLGRRHGKRTAPLSALERQQLLVELERALRTDSARPARTTP
jgi:flagellar M-ring protein FliF